MKMNISEHEWLTSHDPEWLFDFLERPAARPLGPATSMISDRKKKLWTCACIGYVQHLFKDELAHQAMEIVDRCANGDLPVYRSNQMLIEYRPLAQEHGRNNNGSLYYLPLYALGDEPDIYAITTVLHSYVLDEKTWKGESWPGEWTANPGELVRPIGKSIQANILRCIAGNPFRPVSMCGVTDGIEKTEQARHCVSCNDILAYDKSLCGRIAAGIYAERHWVSLPILADALQDAGVPEQVPSWRWQNQKNCMPNPLLEHLRDPGPHARGCWALDLVLGKS